MKKNKKIIIGAVALVAAIIALFFLYRTFSVKSVDGTKNIQVEVVQADGSEKTYDYQTEHEYLGEILQEEKLVEGEMGDYGLFIITVDGVTADDAKQQWWCITKGGEQVNTSADTTPIFDGDKYELTLKEGY